MKSATRFSPAPGGRKWTVARLSNGKVEARRVQELTPGAVVLSEHDTIEQAIAARDEVRWLVVTE